MAQSFTQNQPEGDSARARTTPIFGREEETAALRAAMASAESGLGALITLQGEPGVGKTRLAEDTLARATHAGWHVAWGAGWPERGAPPLWPWHTVLEQLGQPGAAALLEGGTNRVAAVERFTRFRAVTAVLTAAASTRPLLIVIDDAHTADLAALSLARFAVRTLRTARVLLIVTARNEPDLSPEVAEALSALAAEGPHLQVGGLDEAALARFLTWAGPARSTLAPEQLLALTGGNPLLVLDVISGAGAAPATGAGVQRLLAARLTGVGDHAVRALVAAAVLGPLANDELVSAVSGLPLGEVLDAHRTAVANGLIRKSSAPGLTFVHGLIRDALIDRADPAEVADLHARAAATLAAREATTTADRRARVAHHRLAAARLVRDTGAVTGAVIAAREAAGALLRSNLAYEAAIEVLQEAVRLCEDQAATVPTPLLAELAQTQLAGGRLAAARITFRRVLDVTEDSQPTLFAEAALGLGGIWVFEHRRSAAIDHFHAALRHAVAGLPDDQAAVRARLQVRLAAEAVYAQTGTADDVRQAVETVRRLGSPRDLAGALSLLHHSMLDPAQAAARLPVANEIISMATAAGDAVFALMGRLWRTIDLFLLGDPGAERSLADLVQRADALRVNAILYIVEVLRTMVAIRAGRLDEGRQRAEAALALGLDAGDADATAYYGAHLLALHWIEGRTEEILPLAREIADGPDLLTGDDVYRAAVAALAANAGPSSWPEARSRMDAILAAGVDRAWKTSNWLVTLFALVETAAILGDRAAAEQLYGALLPYRDLPVMASIAVVCLGPVQRCLGLAVLTAGRADQAVDHLEQAVDQARRLGNQPLVAISQGDLARALVTRDGTGDRARATTLTEEAAAALEGMGAGARAAALRARTPPAGGGDDQKVEPENRLAWAGGSWEITAFGQRAVVPDSVGMGYLARLVAAPRTDIPAAQLAELAGLAGGVVGASRQDVIDDEAMAQYRRRLAELRRDIDEAEDAGDFEVASRARLELDQLVEHLGGQLGLGGRSRAFADDHERARTAVQKAIRRALARIEQSAPIIGRSLSTQIRTGSVCRYEPEATDAPWSVTFPPR